MENKSRKIVLDNSKDALAHIMQAHGVDILLGGNLKGWFLDYSPNVATLRKNVIFSVSVSGASGILKRNLTATDTDKETAFKQAVQKVIDTYGTERGLVESVVREFTDALGWNISVETSAPSGQALSTVPSKQQATNLQVGQRNVKFGKYNWRVLDVQDGKALLLTEDIIGKRPYHTTSTIVMWSKCNLRRYLNVELLQTFSSEEQIRILEVNNTTQRASKTGGDNIAVGSIFLLNIGEAIRYFDDNNARIAKYENSKIYWWWLRSPGYIDGNAAFVTENGAVFDRGLNADEESGGVRPALWLKL
jgi:hypothetical protein